MTLEVFDKVGSTGIAAIVIAIVLAIFISETGAAVASRLYRAGRLDVQRARAPERRSDEDCCVNRKPLIV